jgi:hypothetical protein
MDPGWDPDNAATWDTFFANHREMEVADTRGIGHLPWTTTRPASDYGGLAGPSRV